MKRRDALSLLSIVVIAMALAMRVASSDTANLSYSVLAGYALFGRAQAIQAPALSWLFTMFSEGVAPLASEASVGRYAVIAGAAVSLLLRYGPGKEGFSMSRPVLATLALGAFLIIHSMLFSPLPDVSILKALSWTVVVATLLSAWSGLSYEARTRLERQLFSGLIALVLVSLPLIVTATGYLRKRHRIPGRVEPSAGFRANSGVSRWLVGRAAAWSFPTALARCRVDGDVPSAGGYVRGPHGRIGTGARRSERGAGLTVHCGHSSPAIDAGPVGGCRRWPSSPQ